MQDPDKLDAWDDYKTYPGKVRDLRLNEFSSSSRTTGRSPKSLTLNLGLRYDYLGVPYETNGLMPLPVGGGNAAFGISGRSFDEWMAPGTRSDPTVFQYVGKNSPHPDIPWYPERLEQLWPGRWLCLAGSVVRRRQNDGSRRISGDVPDWRRIQFHRPGDQRAGQLAKRDVRRRQQRQCLSRSDEAAFVDSGARADASLYSRFRFPNEARECLFRTPTWSRHTRKT